MSEIIDALNQLEREKSVSKELVMEAIEKSLVAACEKDYGKNVLVEAHMDRETGAITVVRKKEVVEEVENDENQISLTEAKAMDDKYEIGDFVEYPLESMDFGRMAAQKARSIIIQNIKEGERDAIYERFACKEHDIVNGVVQRFVDNTIYMNFQNDISFDAGGKVIVFGEHQSTVNENMPLRSLLYIGRAYERLVPPRSRYKKKIVPLPTPEFYTFYNGKEKWEKEKELRLSDAYIVKDGEPSLELKVKVINIRPEEHHEILEKCQVLKEYSQFMEIVQNYQISGEEEPYKKAIKECIEKGILADYLMRKGSEVVNMLLDEYDYETDIEVQREEAREEGRKQGEEEGRKQGTLQKTCALIQKKLEKGKTISEIADDLEDTEENIAHLIEEFQLGRNGS